MSAFKSAQELIGNYHVVTPAICAINRPYKFNQARLQERQQANDVIHGNRGKSNQSYNILKHSKMMKHLLNSVHKVDSLLYTPRQNWKNNLQVEKKAKPVLSQNIQRRRTARSLKQQVFEATKQASDALLRLKNAYNPITDTETKHGKGDIVRNEISQIKNFKTLNLTKVIYGPSRPVSHASSYRSFSNNITYKASPREISRSPTRNFLYKEAITTSNNERVYICEYKNNTNAYVKSCYPYCSCCSSGTPIEVNMGALLKRRTSAKLLSNGVRKFF